jgi:ABC-type glycerol-3-phosphate transport system substrate-binding protein
VLKLITEHGKVNSAAEYLGKLNGHWVAVPATTGSQVKPPCVRIDLFKEFVGLDVTKMYPAGAPPDKELADRWTWDAFLDAAEKCYKGGYPFGMGLGQTTDSIDRVGAVFASHGATLVDQEGRITVKSDAVKQVMEWFKKIVPFLPADTYAYDHASNNKILIAGKSAPIMNPPSAWAVAVRDNPKVGEQCWTFASPKGPKGRYTPGLPYFLGIWNFSPNKSAANNLITHISQRSAVENLVAASSGYDLPAFEKLLDFKTWAEVGPPKGTMYHYPPRGDQIVSLAAAQRRPRSPTRSTPRRR